jgi:hypothetical protein
MSRLTYIKQNPKRTLTGLATLLAAVGVVIGSGANFTSSSANPSNTFSAGTLTQSNSKTGAAILTAANMAPGESKNGTVTITNTGNVPGTFSLSKSALTNSPTGSGGELLSSKLDLVVEDVTGGGSVEVYSGKLGAMNTRALDSDYVTTGIQPFAANAARTYKFTVSFPDGGAAADNPYQGSGTSVQFDWNATS